MGIGDVNRGNPWETYHGPNLGYIQDQYEQYVNDPSSVDPSYQDLFARWGAPPAAVEAGHVGSQAAVSVQVDASMMKKAVEAHRLVWNIRTYGHLAANIDPLGLKEPADTKLLQPETYGLTQADLIAMPASLLWEHAPADVANGWEAIERLRSLYTQSTAYEFAHVHEEHEREWLNKRVSAPTPALTTEERTALLKRLFEVEQFEHFLHRTFVGQKRFSVEGTDMLIPMADELVSSLAKAGTSHLMIGMAHRGRLNMLAHVLGKPYGKIFSEFHHSPNKDLIPSEGSTGINYGWTGDVKYHLGANRSHQEQDHTIRLTLANNPSHLEFVDPVVEGFTRAAQDDRSQRGFPVQDESRAAALLVHGDAAFAGEGIVQETLNFNRLKGYSNGGTIHFIANNRIGFTTESEDSRSTHYASDLAKGFEIPIIHVNADDPEACIGAVRIASEYRLLFKKDFLIDLIGYRRYGHNESDDPDTTQPLTYAKVRNHKTAATLYAEQLIASGVLTAEQVEQIKQGTQDVLKAAYDEVREESESSASSTATFQVQAADPRPDAPETAVGLERLRTILTELLTWPETFKVYPKLQRILERRAKALDEGEKIDWALAETLAFATILEDGKPIRITGQDSQRGTFAHRNLMLHDHETGETFSPLHRLPQAKASFAIHNSPLSEASVLGFEYGYNVYAPETFVLWEAQYGDFANAAQVIIDQFISAGRGKWRQKSSLAMLLPHGYEGQGPEHSSARLERFLQLAGDDNWTVVNLTRASQYFHLLRKQAALSETEEARPLVVMAPKSLIRNARVGSSASELATGTFQPILEQPGLGDNAKKVTRVVMCSGKIAVDLEEALETGEQQDRSWLHIVRVEQLYPFPARELKAVLERYPKVEEIVWVQEEPRNMGSWSYIEPRLRSIAAEGTVVRYVGRPDRSSPASGYQNVHTYEQRRIIREALERE